MYRIYMNKPENKVFKPQEGKNMYVGTRGKITAVHIPHRERNKVARAICHLVCQ
jgi:hypothetical protein